MRRRTFHRLLAIPTLLVCATLAPAANAEQPEALYTREASFAIPFEFEAEPGQSAEARLFVSTDQGKSWKLFVRVQAPVESFDFRAAGEGEYWFVVRTDDTTAESLTIERPSAELRVIVDTTPPKLDVVAEPTADGTLSIRWKTDDAQLAAEPLKITYQLAGAGPMVPPREVEAARTKRQLDKRSGSGEFQWRPIVTDRQVVLRAEARDAAGNVASQEIPLGILAKNSTPIATPSSPTVTANPSAAANTTVAPPMSMRDPSKPLMVNSASFELDYDVERAAAANVTKVEVWGTRDDGRSWVLLGTDEDRQTPCSVNVDAAGMYGFAIVVEAAGGLKGTPPQPGDAPEIRVGVDLTAPLVRLTTAEPDEKNLPCRLKINWDVQEEHLGPQAVTLAYSAGPQGPWLPLAQGIPSSGSHVCEFSPHGPDLAYLKIDVRDEAGNVGTYATTMPIPIEKRQVQFSFAGAVKDNGSTTKPKWFHVLR